jgi:hypothetical protein
MIAVHAYIYLLQKQQEYRLIKDSFNSLELAILRLLVQP